MDLKSLRDYLDDNPKGLWFKRKLYGWGWIPVKWQGWAVVAIAIAIVIAGISIGQADDAPGAAGLAGLLALALIFFFGFKKGERPRWQWGIPKKDD